MKKVGTAGDEHWDAEADRSMRNTERQKCGNFHAAAPMIPAYLQCWPFHAEMCSGCGDVGVNWGAVKTFVFDVLIGWWWQGKVLVMRSLTEDHHDD